MTNASPISDEDRDRFLREVVANSGPNGIAPEEIDAALARFIRMNIDTAVLEMWREGRLKFGWSNNAMLWHLK